MDICETDVNHMTTEQIRKSYRELKMLSNLSINTSVNCQSNRCPQPRDVVITSPNCELDVSDVAVGDRPKRSLITRAY